MHARGAEPEGYGGEGQRLLDAGMAVIDDVERAADRVPVHGEVIGGGSNVFDAHVGEALPAVARNRTERRRPREHLAGPLGAARAVHGAGAQDDAGEAVTYGLPDDVLAVTLAAPVI